MPKENRDMVWKEAKIEELKRFKKALKKAELKILEQKFDKDKDFKEIERFRILVEHAKQSILLRLKRIEKFIPPLLEKEGERSKWEIHLAGLRFLGQKLPLSIALRTAFPMLKMEKVAEILASYTDRMCEVLQSLYDFLKRAQQYLKNYEKGFKILSEFNKQNPELAKLYATLKTFKLDEEFKNFRDSLEKAASGTIEIFIEGPIKLYLMINKSTFLIIFKVLTQESILKLTQDSDELKDLTTFHKHIHQAVEKSETLDITFQLLRLSLPEYLKLLEKEYERLRGQFPTEELRRAFLERFESGVIFKE